jgi:hypothetical protein
LCNQGAIEDERHFVFNCEIYLLEQEAFLREIQSIVPDFDTLNMEEKWKILMSEICVNKTAKYLCEIYDKRQSIMYQ